jgi:ABC-type Na+ efflux pump permease subunit
MKYELGRILGIAIVGLLYALVGYLGISFAAWDFDPSQWGALARVFFALSVVTATAITVLDHEK